MRYLRRESTVSYSKSKDIKHVSRINLWDPMNLASELLGVLINVLRVSPSENIEFLFSFSFLSIAKSYMKTSTLGMCV